MDYLLHIVIVAAIYAIFAMSLNLELGYTGLYNFGHVAFFGIGAYTSALLSLSGWPVPVGVLCALAAAGAAGGLLAVPALRLSGDYFGIATLAFGEMARLVFLNERWLTEGPMGLPGIPRPDWMPVGVAGLPVILAVYIGITALVCLLLWRIAGSPFGRALKVVREDEHVARAFGKNVLWLKVRAVIIGSTLAGLAGALWAHYITYISPVDFTLTETIMVLLCVVLGGRGTVWGPVIGAVAIVFFGEAIRFLPIPDRFAPYVGPIQGAAYGLILVILMLKRPQGILAEYRERPC